MKERSCLHNITQYLKLGSGIVCTIYSDYWYWYLSSVVLIRYENKQDFQTCSFSKIWFLFNLGFLLFFPSNKYGTYSRIQCFPEPVLRIDPAKKYRSGQIRKWVRGSYLGLNPPPPIPNPNIILSCANCMYCYFSPYIRYRIFATVYLLCLNNFFPNVHLFYMYNVPVP